LGGAVLGSPLVQLCPKKLGGAKAAVPKTPSLVLLVVDSWEEHFWDALWYNSVRNNSEVLRELCQRHPHLSYWFHECWLRLVSFVLKIKHLFMGHE
jgi:uncharacterized protein CbrC (UPF0167 family)